MKLYYVYMLQCYDGTYYVGITNDLARRIAEHTSGYHASCYTFNRRPLNLVWSQEFHDVNEAIACEKKIKPWSHNKKSALARGDWKMVRALAKGGRGFSTSSN